jgi:hypothetical protein
MAAPTATTRRSRSLNGGGSVGSECLYLCEFTHAMGARTSLKLAFPSVIMEVTPDEFEEIQTGKLRLPNAWTMGDEIRKTSG